MTKAEHPIAAILLAAGRSTRMGAANKLLQPLAGTAMVRRVAEALTAAPVAPVIVVTGHDADPVARALDGLALSLVHNPDYAQGMATTLRAGLAAVPARCAGALVALADMPWVRPASLEALVAAFAPDRGGAIVIPTCQGRRGNPVLIGRRFFAEIQTLDGDCGAKSVIARHREEVRELALDDPGVLRDIDRPEDLPDEA